MIPRTKHAVDVHFHPNVGAIDEAAADTRIERILKVHPWDRIVACTLGSAFPTPAEIPVLNDESIRVAERFSPVMQSSCYLNATHGAEFCLAELDRCLDRGAVGVKLWLSQFADDPVVDPIAERCIELRLPMLVHTGGHGPEGTEPHSRETRPMQTAALSNRYPEAMIYMAHVGTQWEYGSRAMEVAPNLMVDLGGSYTEAGTTERMLKYSDPSRLLLATDNMSYPSCLAKVTGAGVTGEELEQIVWKNANRLFRFWPEEL